MICEVLVIVAPMIMKGIPIPIEYANKRLNAIPGVVAARVIIVPKIGPIHGVHPAANAIPNKNDMGNFMPVFLGNIFFSKFTHADLFRFSLWARLQGLEQSLSEH